jgi:hypothetical protein
MPEPPLDRSKWNKRADGSEKGDGFFGALKRPDGDVSSELSIGVPINGEEMEIPSLVPTLTAPELHYLLTTDGPGSEMPRSIVDKAIAHAQQRLAAKLPVWAQPGEQSYHIHPHVERIDVPTSGFNDAAIKPMASHNPASMNRYGAVLQGAQQQTYQRP